VREDHSLLVLASTDVGAGSATDLDVALASVGSDGTPGTSVTFDAGGLDDAPTAFAVQDGTVAITGGVTSGLTQDTFLAVRDAAGAPVSPVRIVDEGVGSDDHGVGVAWRGSDPVLLVSIDDLTGNQAVLHSLAVNGVDEEIDFVGASDVVPYGLIAFGDKLWATGAVTTTGDTDAWLARLDGSTLEAGTFDIRGTVFPATQPVDTEARSITAVPGVPDTIVVGGSTATDTGPEWSFAAFNELERPLDDLQAAELVVRIDGEGAVESLAGSPDGAVVAVGTLKDFRPDFGGSNDFSIGMTRVLVDNEKRCDLELAIVSPVELVLRGVRPGSLTLRATNKGTRRCAGQVT
jgi:hypothetical protein